jgi:uncharacterized protein YlxW (UPF0749 family)
MTWMQSPWVAWWISAFALVALGLAACLYLFYSTKRETAELERRIRDEQARFDEERQRLNAELESYRNSLADLQRSLASADTSKRSHILRMYRHGDTALEIAASLQVPQEEVELLLKAYDASGE